MSVMERSSKFLFQIYVELLRIIKPLEKPDSYKKQPRADHRLDINENMISSEQISLHEDDLLDDDKILNEAQER